MSNQKYPNGLVQLMLGNINLAGGDITVALVSPGYVANFLTDANLSDINPGTNIIGSPMPFLSVTITPGPSFGIMNANSPLVFSAVIGTTVGQLVVYLNTGDPTTSTLIFNITDAAGLPLNPNGGNINVVLDSGLYKIMSIG